MCAAMLILCPISDARDHSVQEGLDYTAAWNM